MTVRFFTIAGGNTTALVWGCVSLEQHAVAQTLLAQAEQVGFVEEGQIPSLRMMGDELCVNALLAFAFTRVEVSGTIYMQPEGSPVWYMLRDGATEITLPLPYTKAEGTVVFDTIGYLCTSVEGSFKKAFFIEQAEKYKLPAFGVIQFQDDGAIVPTIYVRDTDSLIVETACGSGSIAASLITGKTNIVQPTGMSITVQQTDTAFTVGAFVQEIL